MEMQSVDTALSHLLIRTLDHIISKNVKFINVGNGL